MCVQVYMCDANLSLCGGETLGSLGESKALSSPIESCMGQS